MVARRRRLRAQLQARARARGVRRRLHRGHPRARRSMRSARAPATPACAPAALEATAGQLRLEPGSAEERGCMAQRNYLVEGLSGAGKSSVYEELIQRGYKAVTTDRAWKYRNDRCGTSKKPSASSKTRSQTCCSSVEAAAIATAFCPISPRSSTSASTTTRCVAASVSAPTTTLASSPRSSSSCSR